MKFIFNLISLLFFSIGVFSQNNFETLGFKISNENQKRVDIRFELYNNLIVVPVILNDRLPLKFILDTGVRTAILTDKSISDFLNMNYSRAWPIYGTGGKKLIDAYVASNVTIELPGVRGKGHALFVLEEDLLQLRNFLGVDVHGILGYELFSRFIVEINYARKVLRIHDPKYFRPKKSYKSIPITVEDTKPYFNTVVSIEEGEDFPVKLMIDTGASHAILLMSNTDRRIVVPGNNLDSYLGRGLSGALEGKVARINHFNFGNYEIRNPIALFPDMASYPDSLSRVARNGTIGGATITRFNIILDFSSEQMYIKKNSKFREPFDFNLSGIVIRAIGRRLNTFEVVDVRQNSAGDKAGIEVGDLIIEINRKPTNAMRLNNVAGYFNSKNRRRITLVVERDGKMVDKVIQLKRLI